MLNRVCVAKVNEYDEDRILNSLPEDLFAQIHPGDKVVLKPNWVLESHKYRKNDWEYVITHSTVISAVLRKAIDMLKGTGKIAIIDGPTTEASFSKLISRYPIEYWHQLANTHGVSLSVIDLRDYEWETHNDVIVKRKKLPGDPKGKAKFNLKSYTSEFYGHNKSNMGYYGADYDNSETNRAHDGHKNLYSVSGTVIQSDVFINLPKLKTHRKAGITACLKNLVGINTYKNYLPHHSEGGPADGGDQFPSDNIKSKIEGALTSGVKRHIFNNPILAKRLSRVKDIGNRLFGQTGQVIRSGNWYGNDTIWRMILDLNKVLFYGNSDGFLREDSFHNCKKYIGIVDAVLAGEGFGPLEPEPLEMGYLFCGNNPVAIDAVCATFMGFDYLKIPSISNAFKINHYSLCPFKPEEIEILINDAVHTLDNIPDNLIHFFEACLGWKGHIERVREEAKFASYNS
jgi:uncharacterized protein (DUF362 family)